jgi:hypothetical protein
MMPSFRAARGQRLLKRTAALRRELARADLSRSDKAVLLSQHAVRLLRLEPRVTVGRLIFFELTTPPKIMRGLRDLVVRRAHEGDIAEVAQVEPTPPALVRERLQRGDLCYVGQLGGRVLCHAWFYRGEKPFAEDQGPYAAWDLAEGTYWSYAAAASAESRASGVFVKVFQTALAALFQEHGAERVQCTVRFANEGSLLMHERLGFRRLGAITAVTLPLLKWLRFDGMSQVQHWLVPRSQDLALPVPPVDLPESRGSA